MKKLMIIGAGGHGKVVADIAQRTKEYDEILFLDDGTATDCMGFSIVGKTSEIETYVNDTTDFFVAIGNAKTRERFLERLFALNANVATLVHPSAVIGSCVEIGTGTVVVAGAVINPCAKIGRGVIVNTCCSIDHDAVVEDYCHISVGARIAGEVVVGKGTWIGAGATVSNGKKIRNECMIGAGAVVVKDVTEIGTYVGVPAKKIQG